MLIKYQFVNEDIDIDVAEVWGSILIDLDRRDYNNQQTERRRHTSLDGMQYEGEIFAHPTDVAAQAIKSHYLQKAFNSLLPQQRELIIKVFFLDISPSDIAMQEGVNKSSVHKRLQRVFEQIKKTLD